MKQAILIILFITFSLNGMSQDTNLSLISFPTPYEYQESKSGFIVKAIVSPLKTDQSLDLSLNSKKLKYTINEAGLFETFLPLVGEPMKLNFIKKIALKF